jgi:hypothetical protein
MRRRDKDVNKTLTRDADLLWDRVEFSLRAMGRIKPRRTLC